MCGMPQLSLMMVTFWACRSQAVTSVSGAAAALNTQAIARMSRSLFMRGLCHRCRGPEGPHYRCRAGLQACFLDNWRNATVDSRQKWRQGWIYAIDHLDAVRLRAGVARRPSRAGCRRLERPSDALAHAGVFHR